MVVANRLFTLHNVGNDYISQDTRGEMVTYHTSIHYYNYVIRIDTTVLQGCTYTA